MPNQKKTIVWQHYNETIDGKKRVGKCKYCGQTYANNATRMKRHLTVCNKCPEGIQTSYRKLLQSSGGILFGKNLHQQPIELGNSDKRTDLLSMESEHFQLAGLEKGGERAFFSNSVQQNTQLMSSCSKQSNFVEKMSKEDQDRADETLARAIFASDTPLSITESQYWKEHYKLICPSYKLPSPYRLSHSLLDTEYNRAQVMVVQRTGQAESLTLMSGGWTDMQGNSLLSIMFAAPEPIFLKAVTTKPSCHTGDYIAQVLSEEIERAGSSKVQALVSDSTSNMKVAWQILKEKYPHLLIFGCPAHGLNLLANDVVNMGTMKTVLAKCKAIVEVFNNHNSANQALKKLQKEKQGKKSALFLPTEIRWGPTIKCLASLLHAKKCLQHASTGHPVSQIIPVNVRKQILDDVFWVQVQGAFHLLLPLSEALKKLEKDTLTLANIPDIFRKLNENLIEYLPSSPLSKKEERLIKEILTKRYVSISHPVHLAANLLHPRHRGQHLSEDELSTALDTLMEFVRTVPNTDEVTVMTDIAEYRAKEKLWSQDIIWQAAENVSPLTWWKGYCNTRQLSRIAVRILSIPPKVTSCEFSLKAFNSLQTKKRNKLTNEHMAKLISVSQNLLFLSENKSQVQLMKQMKCDKLSTDLLQVQASFSERKCSSKSSELKEFYNPGLELTSNISPCTDSDIETEEDLSESSLIEID